MWFSRIGVFDNGPLCATLCALGPVSRSVVRLIPTAMRPRPCAVLLGAASILGCRAQKCVPGPWAKEIGRFCDPSMARTLVLGRDKEGIVIDAGAHGGAQTRTALQYGRKVVAFDCLSDAYNDNLAIFGSNPNVTLLKACVGKDVRLAQLWLASESASLSKEAVSSGVELTKARAHAKSRGRNAEDVIVVPLDALINQPVAVVKMDVQGAEREVFKGMQRILTTYLPAIMYEEAGMGKGSIYDDILQPLGYDCLKYHQPIGTDMVCATGASSKLWALATDPMPKPSSDTRNNTRSNPVLNRPPASHSASAKQGAASHQHADNAAHQSAKFTRSTSHSAVATSAPNPPSL